ncbi:MAG: hypothetical protein ACI9BD_001357 [Candidatus Marinamargulisbacteria bacterium]|jgi:hypothetical protein
METRTQPVQRKKKEPLTQFLPQIAISFQPLTHILHWNRCSLMADFCSKLQILDLKEEKKVQNIVSLIINELLENAVKFAFDKTRHITISTRIDDEVFEIETSNYTERYNIDKLEKILENIQDKNTQDLIVRQIIKNEKSKESQLGLLTLLCNYKAEIVCDSKKTELKNIYETRVRVRLNLKEVEEI